MIFGRKNKDNSSENAASKEKTLVRQALRYSHMPGIIPRIRELGAKFGHFAYMLALIYSAVNLLPKNHPFLNAANVGKYGLRDVIAAAANNVKVDRQNLDKVVVFSAVLMSVVLIAAQIVVIGVTAAMSGPANAAGGVFETPNPNSDVVFIFLSQVFGPSLGLFATGVNVTGTPVHDGLYAMLSFYSTAMMTLAVIIIIYYVVTVVGEAAISGTPFGRRFNSLWAPIRLVVALGLLVPLANGLNSAQYITLYVAKMGSGLATNAWNVFVAELDQPTEVFVQPRAQNVSNIVKVILTAEVCSAAISQLTDGRSNVQPILVGGGPGGSPIALSSASPSQVLTNARSAGLSTVRVAWTADTDLPYDPHCSGLAMSVSPLTYEDAAGNEVPLAFSDQVQIAYIQAVKDAQSQVSSIAADVAAFFVETNAGGELDPSDPAIPSFVTQLNDVYNDIQSDVTAAIQASNANMVAVDNNVAYATITSGGWGKAGLWYPVIGRLNQRYTQVVGAVPSIDIPTDLAESGDVYDWFGERFANWLARTWARIWGGRDETAELIDNLEIALERAEYVGERFEFMASGITIDPNLGASAGIGSQALNLFLQTIFNTDVLFEYQRTGSTSMDPMVKLMDVGDAQVTRALYAINVIIIAKVGGLAAGAVMGAAVASPTGPVGAFAGTIGGMLVMAAIQTVIEAIAFIAYLCIIIGLGAGLMLFYVLPLMPFIYFLFAVVAWVMEIFEAIVAMPLWALSHLKIDGDGLPGQLAVNGYFLILGILLRPILIVFGLIAGYITFGAASFYFHSVYGIIVNNIKGTEAPGVMGSLVYTILFVYLSYNMAIMCFKMIDNVPKSILRWIGQGGATPFSDEKPDPISGSQSMIFAAAGLAAYMRPSVGGDVERGRGIGSAYKHKDKPDKSVEVRSGG